MKKIISLFQRDYDGTRQVFNEVVPGAEWVLAGEGVATRKWDGTSVLIRDGRMFKRYEVQGAGKAAPPGFEPAGPVDPVTGKQVGWVPVGLGPDDKWHREALANDDCTAADYPDGTYELVGPKIQGNPDKFECHQLVPHGMGGPLQPDPGRTFDSIREYLTTADIEGIVWHHFDGRMVKIKTKDFGLKRGAK